MDDELTVKPSKSAPYIWAQPDKQCAMLVIAERKNSVSECLFSGGCDFVSAIPKTYITTRASWIRFWSGLCFCELAFTYLPARNVSEVEENDVVARDSRTFTPAVECELVFVTRSGNKYNGVIQPSIFLALLLGSLLRPERGS
jgi:hypothetical protein